MHERQELVDRSNADHLQVSFFAVLLEKSEKDGWEEAQRPGLRSPASSSSLRRQIARPERLYTYD